MRARRLSVLVAIVLALGAGTGHAQLATTLDHGIHDILRQHDVPGASIAIARNGRLLFAQGYGLADRDAGTPVTPETRFRLASLSKPITAAVILGLVDADRLSIDFSVQALLTEQPRTARAAHAVTPRHLLQHTGAWGPPGTSFEPADLEPLLRRAGGSDYNHTPFRRIAAAALDDAPRHTPGTQFAYSHFGYCVLGAIIQSTTGLSYQQAAQRRVLEPAGATSFALATTAGQPRLPGEARTYDYAGAPKWRVVVDGVSTEMARPDAYWSPDPDERCASGGRWVATPRDYLRVMAFLGRAGGATQLLFDARSSVIANPAKNFRFTHGLFVVQQPDGLRWHHEGSYHGTATAYGRDSAGFEWVVAYNGRPQANLIYDDTYRLLWRTIKAQSAWPAGAPL